MTIKRIWGLILICLLLGLIVFGIYVNINGNQTYSYNKSEFAFSFKYPTQYRIEEEKTWDATSTQEASPDWGVKVYLDEGNQNFVSLFRSFSPFGYYDDTFERSEITTKAGWKARVYAKTDNEMTQMYVLFDTTGEPNFMNVWLTLENAVYKKHKTLIWRIINSIEPTQNKFR